MKMREEYLDRVLDSLGAGDAPTRQDSADPELASLAATARLVRRLGLPDMQEAPAVVSVSARYPVRQRLLAASNVLAATLLLVAIGLVLALVLPGMTASPSGRAM